MFEEYGAPKFCRKARVSRALKARPCCECRTWILAGDPCTEWRGVWDDEVETFSRCDRCRDLCDIADKLCDIVDFGALAEVVEYLGPRPLAPSAFGEDRED